MSVLRRGADPLPRKRYSVEQIINKLREADVLLAQGVSAGDVCRQLR